MSIRPLKCSFCWRRYKYEACLKDHVQKAHADMLRFMLYQKYCKSLQLNLIKYFTNETLRQGEHAQQVERVPVIRRNNQAEKR